ncbi:MAG: hypothetical protein IPI49_13235 [Myxococcales bacterium]|nr:hypothetical protein [Myxococcales bacterium]
MSEKHELAQLGSADLRQVSGGMQGGGLQMIGALLGGLQGAGQAQSAPGGAEQAAPAGPGGLPVDQLKAFGQNPSLQSGMALLTSLLSRGQGAAQ